MSIISVIENFFSVRLDTVVAPGVTKQIIPATLESFRDIQDFVSWRVIEARSNSQDGSSTIYTILLQIYTSDRNVNNDLIDAVTRALHGSTLKGSKLYRTKFVQVIRWERWLTEVEFAIVLPTSVTIEPPITTTLTIGSVPVIYNLTNP